MKRTEVLAPAIEHAAEESPPVRLIDEIVCEIEESAPTFDVMMPTGRKFVFRRFRSHSEWQQAKRQIERFAKVQSAPNAEAAALLKRTDPSTKGMAEMMARQIEEPKISAMDLLELADRRWNAFELLFNEFSRAQQVNLANAYTKAVDEGKIVLSETFSGETS